MLQSKSARLLSYHNYYRPRSAVFQMTCPCTLPAISWDIRCFRGYRNGGDCPAINRPGHTNPRGSN